MEVHDAKPEDVKYAHVLLDVANRRLDRIYTYSIPQGMTVEVGMTVLIPLKSRQVRGMVAYVSDTVPAEAQDVALRPVSKILGREGILPGELLELAFWMGETTLCPIAQSLHAVWPFWRHKLEKWAIPLVTLEDVKEWREARPDMFLAVKILLRARRGGLPVKIYCARLREQGMPTDGTVVEDVERLVEQLADLGVLRWEIRVSGNAQDALVLPEKGQVHGGGQGLVSEGEDNEVLSCGLFAQLTPAQQEAVRCIRSGLERSKESGVGETILLHGVTGSGKTLVYRALVADVVSRGRGAIVLVPEISLTSQVARFFLTDYGDEAAVVHSKLSAAEKQRIWTKVLAGQVKVVIGARSAVFAPLADLGIIIVDEEHDSAYQQEENPKYHVRDVARWRVRQSGGVVVLGSATPSVESYALAQLEKIGLVELTERFGRQVLPRVHIVDMAQELAQGNKGIFSCKLVEEMGKRLARREQCILFLNRRGYATYVFCRECGYVAKCPNCDVAMTYHSKRQMLRCHYCDHRGAVEHHCPECGSIFLKFFGQGTQRLEEEVAAYFPTARVLRLDTDAAEGRGQGVRIVETFRQREADILVGTQMLAKGLDFPEVTLVGVVLADPLLNMPDFRARERAFQLLTQVAGRAGRHSKPGEVIVQTYMPEDRVLRYVADYEYRRFFRDEIAFRHGAMYPPFVHFIRVTVFHEQEKRVVSGAQELAAALRGYLEESIQEVRDVQILGPAPAVLSKLRSHYRWQILVKGKRIISLRKIVHGGVERFYGLSAASGVALNIEVNPLH